MTTLTSRPSALRTSLRNYRPWLELLEDRTAPAVSVVSYPGSVVNMGFYSEDATALTQADGNVVYTFNSTSSSQPIQIGYYSDSNFQPIYEFWNATSTFSPTQAGSATFTVTPYGGGGPLQMATVPFATTTSQIVWQGTTLDLNIDAFAPINGGSPLPSGNQLLLVDDVYPLQVSNVGFGPAPEDGSTYTPTAALYGQLSFSGAGFSLAVGFEGANQYVALNDDGYTYPDGITLTVSEQFAINGLVIAPVTVSVGLTALSGGVTQFSFAGSAGINITGAENSNENPSTSQFSIQFGQSPNLPIVIDLSSTGEVSILQFDASVTGGVDVEGLKLEAKNLGFSYQSDANGNPNGGSNTIWAIYGGATLSLTESISGAIQLGTGPNDSGLLVQNNEWILNSFEAKVGKIPLGAFTLENLGVKLVQSDNQVDWGGMGTVAFPGGWAVGGNMQFINGTLNDIGINFEATGNAPGIPIPGTGLQIAELKGQLSNLTDWSSLQFVGSVGLSWGEKIKFDEKTYFMITGGGAVTINAQEFLLKAQIGVGTEVQQENGQPSQKNIIGVIGGQLLLDWGAGVYSVSGNANFIDGLFIGYVAFTFDEGNQINFTAMGEVALPQAVPLFGGDVLASGEIVFDYYLSESTPSGILAAWAQLGPIAGGVEYVWDSWDGLPTGFNVIGSNQIAQIEQDLGQTSDKQYAYQSLPNVPTGSTSALFQTTYPTSQGFQYYTITLPNGTVITQQDILNRATTPSTTYTVNGVTSNISPLNFSQTSPGSSTTTSTLQILFVGDPSDTFAAIPPGTYQFTVVSDTVMSPIPQFITTVGTAAPTGTVANLGESSSGFRLTSPNQTVSISGQIDPAFANNATIDLFVVSDAAARELTGQGPNASSAVLGGLLLHRGLNPTLSENGSTTFTASVNVDLSFLTPAAYKLYAVVNDGYNPPVTTSLTESFTLTHTLSGNLTNATITSGANGLPGWLLFLDVNQNGQFDPPSSALNADGSTPYSDPFTISVGEDGYYGFFYQGDLTGIDVGVQVKNGYVATSSNTHTVDGQVYVYASANVSSQSFTFNEYLSISGTVFSDLNQDGKQDGPSIWDRSGQHEFGLSGITVYLDLNANGQLDADEPSLLTGPRGEYTFHSNPTNPSYPSLSANTTYNVQIQVPAGYKITGPSPLPSVTTGAGPYGVNPGNDIGLIRLATVTGTVSGYRNNGQVSTTAIPLPGATITLIDSQGVHHTTTSGVDGSYTITGVTPGGATVTQTPPEGWNQIQPNAPVITFQPNWYTTLNPNGSTINPISVAVGDFDDDGYADFAIAAQQSANLYVYYGQADGTLQLVESTLGGNKYNGKEFQNLYQVIAVDWFGTGQPTVAVLDVDNQFWLMQLGSNSRQFEPVMYLSGGGNSKVYPLELVAGDFNGDGFQDIAWSTKTTDQDDVDSIVILFTNLLSVGSPGDPVTNNTQLYTATFYPGTLGGMAVGDLNRDGYADLVASYGNQNESENTTNNFFIGLGTNVTSGSRYAFSNYPSDDLFTTTLGGPSRPAIGFVNNDPWPDLVSGFVGDLSATPTLSYFLNKATLPSDYAKLTATQTLNALQKAASIPGLFVADFNNDGYDDLAYTYSAYTYDPSQMQLVLANQSGSPLVPASAAIVLPNNGAQASSTGIFSGYNQTNVSLQPSDVTSATAYATSMVVYDVNGDGYLDLIFTVPSLGSHGLVILLNTSQGGQASPIYVPNTTDLTLTPYVNLQVDHPGTITGIVFNDRHRNKPWDSNDPIVPNFPIPLSHLVDGVPVGYTVTAYTDVNGVFTFSNLIDGQYQVGAPFNFFAAIDVSYSIVFPSTGAYTATLVNGVGGTGFNFVAAPNPFYYLSMPAGNGPDEWVVRRRNDRLQVVNAQTGVLIFNQPIDEVYSLTVWGADYEGDQLRIDSSTGSVRLRGGVRFLSLTPPTQPSTTPTAYGFLDRVAASLPPQSVPAATLAALRAQLANGQITRSEAVLRLLATPEFTQDYIRRQFRRVLGRQPRPGELIRAARFLQQWLQFGTGTDRVLVRLLTSNEFVFGRNQATTDFARRLVRTLLGPGTQIPPQFQGMTPSRVVRTLLRDVRFVARTYQELFGVTPPPEALAQAQLQLASGVPTWQVLATLAASTLA